MNKKEKQLLLKDLCGRLPYGFTIHRYDDNCDITFEENKLDEFSHFLEYSDGKCFKPYLRPLSSMTEEEKLHVELRYSFFYHDGVLDNVHIFEAGGYYDRDGNYDPPCKYREQRHVTIEQVIDFIHWLNSHHFDYHGLIEKGLALEAPEEMYKEK